MSNSQHTVAALFVETGGRYFGLPGIDPWDIERDARKYDGDLPVVAHPPCFLWVNLAAVNWKRYKREKPAWYPGGTDYGCFESALAAVRRCPGTPGLKPRLGALRFDAPGARSLEALYAGV